MNCLDSNSNYALFMDIIRLHGLNAHMAFTKKGVYPGQPQLLFCLHKNDGQSQAELAKTLRMKPPTVTVMLQRMERVGMVKREQDKDDQRVVRVYITDYGRKICAWVYQETQRIEEGMFHGFSGEDEEILNGFLIRLRDNLKDSIDSMR